MHRNDSQAAILDDLGARRSPLDDELREASAGVAEVVEQQLESVADLLAECEQQDGCPAEATSRTVGTAQAFARGDWRLGGWSTAQGLGAADPFDWLSVAEGPIVLALGTSIDSQQCLALPPMLLRCAMRAHLESHKASQRLTKRLASSLASLVIGSAEATLFCATITPREDMVYWAAVGHVTAVRLHGCGCEPLLGESRPLAGQGLGGRFTLSDAQFDPGDTLLAASVAGGCHWLWESYEMFQALARHREVDAQILAEEIGQRIVRAVADSRGQHDGVAVLVAQRTARQVGS